MLHYQMKHLSLLSKSIFLTERFQRKPKGLSQEKDSLLTTGVSRSVRRTKSGAMMDEFESDDGRSVRRSKRTEEYFEESVSSSSSDRRSKFSHFIIDRT